VADSDSEKDSIDAEFIDVDEDKAPHWPQQIKPKRGIPWGAILALICLVGAGGGLYYWTFGRGENAEQAAAQPPWSPGFYELLDCQFTTSLDGTKEMNLYENHVAVMYDKTIKENGKFRAVNGGWTFDEATKLYAVTLNGEVTIYSIVKPEGVGACMLVKGDISAADLRSSWFSAAP